MEKETVVNILLLILAVVMFFVTKSHMRFIKKVTLLVFGLIIAFLLIS